MPAAYRLELSAQQVQALTWARDHHPKAYVRVKAAAILKVWQGASIRWVAAHGLLKPVRWEAVKDWITRYLAEGIEGLLVQKGRGRKPAFSPCGTRSRNGSHRGGRGAASVSLAL